MTSLPAQPAHKITNQHLPLVIRIVSSKKTTGYIQNMLQCLKITNLQSATGITLEAFTRFITRKTKVKIQIFRIQLVLQWTPN